MFTKEQVNLYLKRIGLEGPMPLCRETLDRIIFAHYQHIPYENLDTMNGIPVLLSEEALFDKIVCRKRGGWCFELNAALSLLLQGMGFEVTLLAARFLAGEDPKVIPLRRHEVLLVTLPDGQYLCDAGIMRESCRRALKLEYGLIQSDGMGEYKLEKDPFYGNLLYQKLATEDFERYFGFTFEPQVPADYIMPSFYCEHHPDSPFTHHRMVGRYTEKGSINLVGNLWKRIEGGKVAETREIPDEEIAAVLKRDFGIEGIW